MAQERPQREATTPLDDSLFYDRGNAPTDLPPPVRLLLQRGWKCQADNPRLEGALWFPPWVKEEALVTQANLFGNVMRPSKTKHDSEGNPLSEPQWEQLKRQDGSVNGNVTEPITQTIIEPATKEYSFAEAVEMERDRKRRAQQKAVAQKRLEPIPA